MSKVTKKKEGKGKKKGKKEEEVQKPVEKKSFPIVIGFGKFEFQNKIIYIGAYKQESSGKKVRDGYGMIIHQTSDNSDDGKEYYEGQWKNDLMEGYGIYHYSNGDVYEGFWKNSLHHGFGKYIFTDGFRYEGNWKEHKMHGSGKYIDMNNLGFGGEFRDGCFFSKEQARLKEEKRLMKKIKKMKLIPFHFFKNWDDAILKIDTKNYNEILGQFFAKVENMGMYFNNLEFPIFEDYKPEYWNDSIRWIFGQPKKKLKILPPKKTKKKKDDKKKDDKKKEEKKEEEKKEEEKKEEEKKEEEKKEENEEDKKEDKEDESENAEVDIPKMENGPIIEINVPKNASDVIFLNKDSLLAPQLQDQLDSGQVIEIKSSQDERIVQIAIGYNRDLNKWLIIYFNDNQAPEKEKRKEKSKSKKKKK